MPRPSTREEIVQAGLKCLAEKGFNAVGVQDITDAAGVPKGSFYNHFQSKEALGAEIVERYGANQTRREILTDQTAPPLQRLRRHFDRISVLYVDSHFARNCILSGFSAELANQVYTYFMPYLTTVIRLDDAHVGIAFFVWGVSAVTGLFLGGTLSDRFGPRAVMVPSFAFLALAFAGMSAIGVCLSGKSALTLATAAIVIWGLAAWGFFPAQQSRLMQVAGLKTAPIALSLNASFMYLGFSLGAMLGSLVLMHAPITTLGLIGAVCQIGALLIVLATVPSRQAAPLKPR
jgi:AcrR family transcriptional regulator